MIALNVRNRLPISGVELVLPEPNKLKVKSMKMARITNVLISE
jgi:hypothetical protein